MASYNPRTSKARRREAFWSNLAIVVGCVAVVALVAAVMLVAGQRVLQGQSIPDESYIMESYQKDAARQRKGELNSHSGLTERSLTPSTPVANESERTAGIQDIESKRPQISEAVRQFFAADSIANRLLWVRDPARVKPLMEDYHRREKLVTCRLRSVTSLLRVDEPDHALGFVQAVFEDATPATLVVEESSPGTFLIDWECLVRYGEMSWPDFRRQRPTQPTLMRLVASLDMSRVNASLLDRSSDYLELRYPGEEGTLVTTVNHREKRYRSLLDQLKAGQWKDVPVTLKLSFKPSNPLARADEVEIEEVLGKGWLNLDDNQKS